MKLENLQIQNLILDPENARQHNEQNINAIMGSLEEFGQRKPIVITADGVIVAGNGTVEAAKRLGWLEIQAVRIPDDWTPEQTKAFALADNRTAELASWNSIKLSEQLIELEEADFKIEEFGFAKEQFVEDTKPEEFPTFDDVEETSHRCPKCHYEWNGKS
jgi:ParB-like chromosome segregation protein Spo0J